MTARGIRNNNPGNLRLGGVPFRGERIPSTDPDFRQFTAIEWGWRAVMVTLRTYAVRYGLDTVEKIIARWAPPSENRTQTYIETVCRRTGFGPDVPLDWSRREDMVPLAGAIGYVECGREADAETLARGWELFSADFL